MVAAKADIHGELARVIGLQIALAKRARRLSSWTSFRLPNSETAHRVRHPTDLGRNASVMSRLEQVPGSLAGSCRCAGTAPRASTSSLDQYVLAHRLAGSASIISCGAKLGRSGRSPRPPISGPKSRKGRSAAAVDPASLDGRTSASRLRGARELRAAPASLEAREDKTNSRGATPCRHAVLDDARPAALHGRDLVDQPPPVPLDLSDEALAHSEQAAQVLRGESIAGAVDDFPRRHSACDQPCDRAPQFEALAYAPWAAEGV